MGTSELSISKSVGRVFQVLEYFREARTPRSTPDLERELNYPYSSARVILKSLHELGYLDYNGAAKKYFPTHKLSELCDWVPIARFESSGLFDFLDSVYAQAGETTLLSARGFIFSNNFRIKNGVQPMSVKGRGGVGLTLTNSVTGRVLLSQMTSDEIDQVVLHTDYWAKATNQPSTAKKEDVLRSIEFIRKHGYFSNYDGFKKGVGTISCPIPAPMPNFPLAISISAPIDRIRHREAGILQMLRRQSAAYMATVPATHSPS